MLAEHMDVPLLDPGPHAVDTKLSWLPLLEHSVQQPARRVIAETDQGLDIARDGTFGHQARHARSRSSPVGDRGPRGGST
jgi:hypothetical protein